jgi:hypothetical protein
VTLTIHLAGNPHHGFFRDELYFIICGFYRRSATWIGRPSRRCSPARSSSAL